MALKPLIPADLLDSVQAFEDKRPQEVATDDYSYIKTDGLNSLAGWVEQPLNEENLSERADREDDEGYARTKDEDDAWNKKLGHTPPVPKPTPARKREPIDIWKKKPGLDEATKQKDNKDEPFNYDEWKNSSVKKRALPGWGKNGEITKMVKAADETKKKLKEDVIAALQEARMPLHGHPYHDKTDEELRGIQKDAGEAARVQKGMSSEGKYLDQMNDASTILHYRSKKKVNEDTIDESVLKASDQAKTTLKHIKDPSLQDKYAAYDIKPGIKGYRDRIDLLNDAKAKGKLKEDAEQLDELSPAVLQPYADAAKTSAAKLSKQGAASEKRGNYEGAYNKFAKATKRLARVSGAENRIAQSNFKQKVEEAFQAVQPQPQRGPTQVEMDKAQSHISKKFPDMKLNGVAIDPDGKMNVKAVKVVNDVVEETELTELDSTTYKNFIQAKVDKTDDPKSIHQKVKDVLAIRRAKEKIHDKEVDARAKGLGRVNESIDRVPPSHTIEAHGIKGMKRSPWRKTFKHADHLNDWAEKNDAEVYGQRDLESAKKSKLSS